MTEHISESERRDKPPTQKVSHRIMELLSAHSARGPPSRGRGVEGTRQTHLCQGVGVSTDGQNHVSDHDRNTRQTPSNPDTKIRKRHSRQTTDSVSYEYGCNDPQQNTSKVNPAVYTKGHTPRPSGLYPRNAKLAQNEKMDQHKTSC